MKKQDERPNIDLIVDGISDPRNVPALLARDSVRLIAAVQQGLASRQHAAFVKRLEAARRRWAHASRVDQYARRVRETSPARVISAEVGET